MSKRISKILWHDSTIDENKKAVPPVISTNSESHLDGINEGELFINNATEDPTIFIRDNKGNIVGFKPGVDIKTLLDKLSGFFLRKDQADQTEYLLKLLGGAIIEQGLTADSILVKSDLTAQQLKSAISSALSEEGDATPSFISVSLIEEGDGNETVMSTSLIESPIPGSIIATLGELDNVDDTVDTAPDGCILRKNNGIWIAAPDRSGAIVVDLNFGTNNNTGTQESASLITAQLDDDSASIGITSTGKPIVVYSYRQGAKNNYRELALLSEIPVNIYTDNQPFNESNVGTSTPIAALINNISFIEIEIETPCVAITAPADTSLEQLKIYDDSNADITDLFTNGIRDSADPVSYLYFNNDTPVSIGTIKLKINSNN